VLDPDDRVHPIDLMLSLKINVERLVPGRVIVPEADGNA
jgi:hypothetical protein